jgi:hypothetical protein
VRPKLRPDRWLTLSEVALHLEERRPKLKRLIEKRRREYVLRVVRRLEKREGERCTKRVGREWFISRNAIEKLKPWDLRTQSDLEHDVADLAQKHRQLHRQVNGHGARLRIIEEKEKLTAKFIADFAALDCRKQAAR